MLIDYLGNHVGNGKKRLCQKREGEMCQVYDINSEQASKNLLRKENIWKKRFVIDDLKKHFSLWYASTTQRNEDLSFLNRSTCCSKNVKK
jgi:hypothetical protein